MLKKISALVYAAIVLVSCNDHTTKKETEKKKDTVVVETQSDTTVVAEPETICVNDSLNAMANVMSGIMDSNIVFKHIQNSTDFKNFNKTFEKRWQTFDSARLTNLKKFRETELSKIVKKQTTLFYPFSGPDILYAQTFFPDADKFRASR